MNWIGGIIVLLVKFPRKKSAPQTRDAFEFFPFRLNLAGVRTHDRGGLLGERSTNCFGVCLNYTG